MTREIYCTNGSVVLVDDEDYQKISMHEWWVDRRGCPYRQIKNNDAILTVRISQEVLGVERGTPVWSINKDYLDNRKINLSLTRVQGKPADQSWNVAKSGPRNGKTFKGIHHDKRNNRAGGPYCSYITKDGKRTFIGSYSTPEEAAKAYDEVAFKTWGTGCYLNFPEYFGLPPRRSAA